MGLVVRYGGFMAITDPNGRVQIPVDLTGGNDFFVTASKAGYRTQSQDVLDVVDGEVRPINFQIVGATATLDIFVVDGAGNPVAGVDIVVVPR